MDALAKNVATILETLEVGREPRVDHWFTAGIRFEIGLGDVCADAATLMNQHMVPRLLTRGLGLIGVVPFFSRLTAGIKGHDHPAVTVVAMLHQLAELEMDGRNGTSFETCERN